ncbi:MAG: orotate phosphoribosyltransferase [Myxococcota bacterium]
MTEDERRNRLLALLREHSIQHGTFQLSSGGTSSVYVDVRQTTLNAEGAEHVAHLVLARLHPDVQAVGGPTLGADPIACAAAAWSRTVLGRDIHAFLIRKEKKGHGTGRFVEGLSSLAEGARVCVVEDTTTTGGSLLRAVDRARQAGLDVKQCLTIVEREGGAVERFREAGLTLESIVTWSELVP